MFNKKITDKVTLIKTDCISDNPFQPRKNSNEQSQLGLIQSIKKNGIIQPITVRRVSKTKYELICGSRRLNAVRSLKLSEIPCIIKNVDDKDLFAFSLIENIQRENLGFIQEAKAIDRLLKECNYTQIALGQKLGLSQSAIANKLRILKLGKRQLDKINEFSLTERHARALLKIKSEEKRNDILNEIIVKGLNVEQTDKLIDALTTPKTGENSKKIVVKDIRLFLNTINKAIKVMKNSGIGAKSTREEDDSCIKYTVIIPKD